VNNYYSYKLLEKNFSIVNMEKIWDLLQKFRKKIKNSLKKLNLSAKKYRIGQNYKKCHPELVSGSVHE